MWNEKSHRQTYQPHSSEDDNPAVSIVCGGRDARLKKDETLPGKWIISHYKTLKII